MPSLPEPSREASQQSQKLVEKILDEIKKEDGWISFAHYMRLALYSSGLGYYSAGSVKFGQQGDFVTSPEISSLFGRTLANQATQFLRGGDILELGAGSGKLALDLLLELEKKGSLPKSYYIMEVSADLKKRQSELFLDNAPHLLEKIVWLEYLPDVFEGLILANEVLDAIPVHILRWERNEIFERGVSFDGALSWRDNPLTSGPLFETASQIEAPPGYVSEINLEACAWVKTLASLLKKGVILLIDYGFGKKEYYHPQRNAGTLMCHYRQQSHDDPFYLPGLQDITSHVNFSSIAEAAIDSGLDFLGYTTQANFLINCKILDFLAEAENTEAYFPLSGQLQKLLSPAEMGELFKILAVGKGINFPLIGFSSGDKSRLL